MNLNSCGSQIIYQKNPTFKIFPRLDAKTQQELESYFAHQKLFYENIGGFFWRMDPDTSDIIINNDNEEIAYDFHNHLIKIISWLYKRGYKITGSFYYRNCDAIEYIEVNNSIIKNRIIIDPLDNTENMSDIELKIHKYLTKTKIDKLNTSLPKRKKKLYRIDLRMIFDVVVYTCLFFTYSFLLCRQIA